MKWILAMLVIATGLCIGAWAVGRTTQMQGDHSQGIAKALENAGITPATSTSPSR